MTAPTTPAALIFAPAESRTLALTASRQSGIELGDLEEREYLGGEFKLRPLRSVRGRTVFVVQSLAQNAGAPIERRLVRLLFLLHALRDAGASCLVPVMPYLAYARKDRRTKPRDPVYTRYVAQLMEGAGADRVVTLDVHNVSALDNAFRVPVDHLSALPMMAAHFAQCLSDATPAVVSPDTGGLKRAQIFRELLERRAGRQVSLLFVEKHRNGQSVSGGTIVGDARGRETILLDDLCATGATLLQAATALRCAGASRVHVAVTHFPIETGIRMLAAHPEIAQVVTTDSVGYVPSVVPKLTVLAVGNLLGHALCRIVRNDSLAALSHDWPPEQLSAP